MAYPSNIPTFTTKTDGVDYPQAEHINTLQSTLTDVMSNVPAFIHHPDGFMFNGKINVTVSSNDLILAVKTYAGTDPSASDPVYVKINGTVRSITTALSVTKADGTNWSDLGSENLGGLPHDLFAYLVWNTNLSPDAVDIFWSRVPYGNVYSDFSNTTTNYKYAAINATAPASTDDCVVIGRFEATLSLSGSSHLWTVPTYTSNNLIQKPVFSTRLLSYTCTLAGQFTDPTGLTTTGKYMCDMYSGKAFISSIAGGSPTNGSGFYTWTLPFSSTNVTTAPLHISDANVGRFNGVALQSGSTCIGITSAGTVTDASPIAALASGDEFNITMDLSW